MRYLITGGAGFLGHPFHRERRRGRGIPTSSCPPSTRSTSTGEPRRPPIPRTKARRGHPPGREVGGIGATAPTPAVLFYANIDGPPPDRARPHPQIHKFVQIGTICAYPSSTPRPFNEDDLWNGYPEDQRPLRHRQEGPLVMCQAYRDEYGLNAIYLLPVNLYGPRDNFFDPETSHVIPALIRKCVEARESARPRSSCGEAAATKAPPPPANSSTCKTPRRRSHWPPNGTTVRTR